MTQPTSLALITGASGGIGTAIAQRLSKDGVAVILNYATNKTAAEEVAQEIQFNGGHAFLHQADVSDPHAMAQMFDDIEQQHGPIDILVNSAGIMHLAPLAEVDDEALSRQIAINLNGTVYGLREAAKRMPSGGRIINLSTSVVGLNLEGYGVYAATKAAVESLTRIGANEFRGRSVTVNAIAPGPTATELLLKGKSEAQIARLANMAPMERLGTPEDIASMVAFLCGPEGQWVNGQVLRVNGGLV